jgi:tRNA threonylcarbamoyladenosine biosynthesis protein TsaB
LLELYIETAGGEGRVAVVRDGVVASEHATSEKLAHGRESVSLVEKALSDVSGATLTAVDRIVWNAGPGSFTGMRIGAAIAQALRYTNVRTRPSPPVAPHAASRSRSFVRLRIGASIRRGLSPR